MKFRKLPERRKSKTSNYDSCAAFGCRSTENESYNVSFHCFPGSNEYISVKNEFGKVEYIDRLKAWKTVLKISRMINPRMRVCSLHFKKTDFIAQCFALQKRYLKSNAIPSCSLKPAVSQAQLERLRQNNNVSSKKFKDQVVKVKPVPTTGQWQNFVIKKVFQDHENGELHFMRADSTTIDQQCTSLEDNKQFKDQVVKVEPVPTTGQWQNFVIKKVFQDHESGELHFVTDDSTTIDQQNSSLEDDAVNEESDFMIDDLLFKAQQYNKNNEEIDPTTILTHESFENTVSAHLDDNVNGGFDFMIDNLLFKADQHNTQYEEIIPTAGSDFESPVNITSDAFQSSIHENLSSQVKEALFKVTHYIKNEERHLTAMPTIFENSENVASAVNQDCINEELCSGMNNINIKEDQCDVNNTELNPTIVPTDENFINARPLKLVKDIAIQVDLINEDMYDGTKSYFCDNIKTDSELNIATGIDNFDIFNEIVEMVSSSKGNKYNNNLKMSARQQVIMTFVRLKHKLSYSFLAILFDCSSRCCQEVFRSTLQVLSLSLIKYYSSDPDSRYLRMFARIFDP